jgi:hypothetical protein
VNWVLSGYHGVAVLLYNWANNSTQMHAKNSVRGNTEFIRISNAQRPMIQRTVQVRVKYCWAFRYSTYSIVPTVLYLQYCTYSIARLDKSHINPGK